uniref:Uncharacterized protein n=1 Tax=Ditylenchus dipsaci TaxID=166011 RepID=A0A915DIK5_9BILA
MEIGQLPSFTNEQTGCEVTIPQYYNTIKFNEYNVRVSHLNFPGVIGSFASRKIDEQPEIFPMECLEIVKDQKLNLEKTKMIPNLQTKLHKVNVIEPAERRKQIKMHANQIGLFTQSNKILQAFGIHVEESSDDVPLAFQQSPTLDYGDQNTIKAEGNASWKATNSKFIKSALIAKWTVLFPENESMDVKSFVTKYRQVAEQKGITFEADVIPSKFSGDLNFVEAFKYFEANSIQFVLLIDSLASETHDTLKYCEARWK